MSRELTRLKKEDFKEAVDLLNSVFTVQNGVAMDFESLFPRIFIESDETMGWHEGAKIDGKLCGIAASYPLTYRVGDKTLKLSAGGNVAVDSAFRGQGIMQSLLNEIDKQDRQSGFDISYLHGDRFRYRNFGYERCGIEYSFTLTRQMLGKDAPKLKFNFVDLRSADQNTVKSVYDLYNTGRITVARDFDSFMPALIAHSRTPFAVFNEENLLIGYFSVNMKNFSIAEAFIEDTSLFPEVIKNFMVNFNTGRMSISLPSYDPLTSQCRIYADRSSIIEPGNFKIYNFKNVVEFFMKEKLLHTQLPDGEITIDSEALGKWSIKKSGTNVLVDKFEGDAEYVLPDLTVYPFLFGPVIPDNFLKGKKAELINAWFPLELYCPYLT